MLAPLKKMAEAGAVAFSDDGSPVLDNDLMRRALRQSRELGLPVIDHCEDTAAHCRRGDERGKVSARLGLSGIPAAAEENMVARDLSTGQSRPAAGCTSPTSARPARWSSSGRRRQTVCPSPPRSLPTTSP